MRTRTGIAVAGVWIVVAFSAAAEVGAWLTADRNPIDLTRAWIDDTEETIDAVVYKFDEGRVRKSLRRALDRGVRVRLLADQSEARASGSLVQDLAKAGARVRLWKKGKLHAKFAVFDGDRALAGSFNWTRSARRDNVEVALTMEDPASVKRMQELFERLWDEASKKKSK